MKKLLVSLFPLILLLTTILSTLTELKLTAFYLHKTLFYSLQYRQKLIYSFFILCF